MNNSTIMWILEKEKLTGPNFANWIRNLRVALRAEKKLVHLEPMIPLPPHVSHVVVRDAYYTLYDAQQEVDCIMLARGWSVDELLSLEDEGLLSHIGTPWLPYASRTWCGSYLIPSPLKKENPTKDSIFHHFKEVGHWRRNCPTYMAELKKKQNTSMASTSGIFTIELYVFKSWVYDTGCGTCHTPNGA
ncbi:hypothetical protein Tco_1327590 [Tanacetum coccineum]